ncbi:family 16 glycosylhydrolase [Streptomyces sp. NPDC057301]|uniref:family 16 glycosylhydrolase n=1 Tax=Streptomyces sp. NPDC057301 TaxID=3346093 RepID=UPI00362D9708
MRVRRRLACTALATAWTACLVALGAATPSVAVGPSAPGGALYTERFRDDFNTVDTGAWDYRRDGKGNSCQQTDNVKSRDGYLVIELRKETVVCGNTQTYQYTGGGLISKKKFRYGYYETRAKINTGSGWHAAFWSMCGDGSSTTPACRNRGTEIDGFEIDSHAPSTIRHNIADWSKPEADWLSSGKYDVNVANGTTGWTSTDWHTYGYLYDETGVTFYIDGQTATKPTGGKLTYSAEDRPADWMSIWLTSIAIDHGIDDTRLPNEVLFDYVTYSQKDYYIDNDGPTAVNYAESGSGWAQSALPGLGKSTSRYSCSPDASARWNTTNLPPGTYTVWVRSINDPASDPAAKVTYTHDGQTYTSTLNQRTTPTGWVQIGDDDWTLGAGDQSVKLASSGTGCLRADSVKFVRTG